MASVLPQGFKWFEVLNLCRCHIKGHFAFRKLLLIAKHLAIKNI